jgi:hypothetical protein
MSKPAISESVVLKHLLQIYGTWHSCALRESQITAADKKRGLKVGQLCDDCTAYAKAHLTDILTESKENK